MNPMVLEGTTAAAAKSPNGGGIGSIVMIVVYIAIFAAVMYFAIFRPQKKKQKAEAKLREPLQVGDNIITIGGIYGRVVAVKEDTLIIESGPDRNKYQVAKWSVQTNETVHDGDGK